MSSIKMRHLSGYFILLTIQCLFLNCGKKNKQKATETPGLQIEKSADSAQEETARAVNSNVDDKKEGAQGETGLTVNTNVAGKKRLVFDFTDTLAIPSSSVSLREVSTTEGGLLRIDSLGDAVFSSFNKISTRRITNSSPSFDFPQSDWRAFPVVRGTWLLNSALRQFGVLLPESGDETRATWIYGQPDTWAANSLPSKTVFTPHVTLQNMTYFAGGNLILVGRNISKLDSTELELRKFPIQFTPAFNPDMGGAFSPSRVWFATRSTNENSGEILTLKVNLETMQLVLEEKIGFEMKLPANMNQNQIQLILGSSDLEKFSLNDTESGFIDQERNVFIANNKAIQTVEEQKKLIFSKDVLPLVSSSCGACHIHADRGGFGAADKEESWNAERSKKIRERVLSTISPMPPKNTGQNDAFSSEQKQLLIRYLDERLAL